MNFIIGVLVVLAAGSFIWTVLQVVRPELFFRAEEEANLKRKRPLWYLLGGIIGLVVLVILWVEAIHLKLIPVWIFTVIFTVGSLKAFGIVFFYNKFSGKVSQVVGTMQDNKRVYWAMVASRAVLCVVLSFTALYFYNLTN